MIKHYTDRWRHNKFLLIIRKIVSTNNYSFIHDDKICFSIKKNNICSSFCITLLFTDNSHTLIVEEEVGRCCTSESFTVVSPRLNFYFTEVEESCNYSNRQTIPVCISCIRLPDASSEIHFSREVFSLRVGKLRLAKVLQVDCEHYKINETGPKWKFVPHRC